MRFTHHLLAASALAVLAATASAQPIFSEYFKGPHIFLSTTGVPIKIATQNNPKTEFTFNVTASEAGPAALTYSAVCSVSESAGDDQSFVDIDVVVNAVTVEPTVGSHNFCTADGNPGFSGASRSSITVEIALVTGSNTVKIIGRVVPDPPNSAQGLLANSSIVIH